MGTREELHQLVSSLPEDAIDAARAALLQFQTGPAPLPPDHGAALEQFRQAQRRVHERMEERMREMVEQMSRRNPGHARPR